MKKYKSLTTPNIEHDAFNLLAEFIYLNKFGNNELFPWRGEAKNFWSKTVASIKKLIRDFDITIDQMAFYIYSCHPKEINNAEFAKATIVPKILFQRFNLHELLSIYAEKFSKTIDGLEGASYKRNEDQSKHKTLLELIKELEKQK